MSLVKVLIEIIFVVEIDDEDLILRIAGPHQIQRSLVDFIALLAHRSGIVDHDAHRHGDVFVLKEMMLCGFSSSKTRKGGLRRDR